MPELETSVFMNPGELVKNGEERLVARGGIEPPTRGFSVRANEMHFHSHQWVIGASVARFASRCRTVQD